MAQLQTKRLHMEPWTADLVRAAINDKRKLGDMLEVTVPDSWPNPDFVDVLPFILQSLQRDPHSGRWSGLIIHSADQTVIGTMGFKQPPNAEGMVEMGYDIIPEYQGSGYATEMARELIAWAFRQPGVNRVTAECLRNNIGSIRVLQKVGMTQLDPSEDMLNWELLKNDFTN